MNCGNICTLFIYTTLLYLFMLQILKTHPTVVFKRNKTLQLLVIHRYCWIEIHQARGGWFIIKNNIF